MLISLSDRDHKNTKHNKKKVTASNLNSKGKDRIPLGHTYQSNLAAIHATEDYTQIRIGQKKLPS